MGKVKYSEEMKLQTVKYVHEGGKSATKISKELGIDTTILAKNSFSLCSKALFCYAQKRNDPNARKTLHLRRKYATIEDVKTDLYRYIEIFYNRKLSAELQAVPHPRLYESLAPSQQPVQNSHSIHPAYK